MDSYRLEQAIGKVRNAVENKKPIPSDDMVRELKRTYPKLHAMICKPDCDTVMLAKLIELQTGIASGGIEQSSADEAFGQVAVDTYIKPKCGK